MDVTYRKIYYVHTRGLTPYRSGKNAKKTTSARKPIVRTVGFLVMKNQIDEYLEWKATYTRQAKEAYRMWVKRLHEFTSKKVERITLNDIARFVETLREKYAPKNVEFGMNIIHNYFTYWKARGLKCLSPLLIRVPRCRGETKRPANDDIYRRILDAWPTSEWIPLRDSIILHILHDTGCRISEVLAIDFKNLDEYSALVPTRKTREFRTIYWSEETHKLLFEKYIPIRICMNTDCPALFVSKYGESTRGRLTPKTFQRNLKEVCELLDIDGITAHSFRHGKALSMLQQSPNCLPDIQFVLGHSNPASSFKYLRLSQSEIANRAKRYLI